MKYNKKKEKNQDVVINYEGEQAYKLNKELELYSMVVTTMVDNQFYRTKNNMLERLEELVKICDKEFVMKLGIYAREKMYLRTIPLVLAILLVKQGNLDKKYVSRVIQRADEIMEILAIYKSFNGKLRPIPKSLQRGIADSFQKFDEYQFGKYKGEDKEITLRDVMFLTHPKPENEIQKELFKKIADKELEIPYTWEVELSKGNRNKGEVWKELIQSGRLGYMSLLRNLRNILNSIEDKEIIEKVFEIISSKDRVLKSKQLPFRFLSAYKEIKDNKSFFTSKVLIALENAISYSVDNIKGITDDDKILIASDVSGSMERPISEKSKVLLYDIGLLLTMLLQTKCYCITGIFGDIFRTKQFPKNSILRNVIDLQKIANSVGYSTNGWKVLEYALECKVKFNKIFIFTDCQMWDSIINKNHLVFTYEKDLSIKFDELWKEYKKMNHNAKLYFFDLAGYGDTPVRIINDVYFVSGWSDKIFDMLYALENGGSIVEEIKKIEICKGI